MTQLLIDKELQVKKRSNRAYLAHPSTRLREVIEYDQLERKVFIHPRILIQAGG